MERLWATWRATYVANATESLRHPEATDCVFCELISRGASLETGIVYLDELTCCVLNAYPYGSGHLLVLPTRHEPRLLGLSAEESANLWATAQRAVAALEHAYGPDGINLGANLGEAAGAGIPSHLHLHALPRWQGDTNFMTSIGETRVLPESLEQTYVRVADAWE